MNQNSELYTCCPQKECGFAFNTEKDRVCQICYSPLGNNGRSRPDEEQQNGKNRVNNMEERKRKKNDIKSTSNQTNTDRFSFGKLSKIRELSKTLNEITKDNFQFSFPKLSLGIVVGFFLASIIIIILNSIEDNTIRELNSSTQGISSEEQFVGTGEISTSYSSIEEIPNFPKGIFTYGGSCLAAIVNDDLLKAIALAHSQFQPQYVIDNCTTKIEPLLSGELSFLYSERPLTIEEKQLARSKKIELEVIPIALDGIVPYTNKALNLRSLTISQLKDIFTGRITNWQQVGGPDLPIIPIVLNSEGNVAHSELHFLLGNEERSSLSNSFLQMEDYTQAIKKVSQTTGAISLASVAIIKNQSSVAPMAISRDRDANPVSAILDNRKINQDAFTTNDYPLTRSLFLVIKKDRSIDETVGVAYANALLSEQGQKIIAFNDLIPIFPWH